jgi:hypothetical protein
MNDTMITRFILHISFNCFYAVHTHNTYVYETLLLKFLPTSDSPPTSYRPPIFFVSLCTRLPLPHPLSLSPLFYLSLPLHPAKAAVDAHFTADLMNSNYGQRWPIWRRRPQVSRELFRLRSRTPSSGYFQLQPYILLPTAPLRHVGPGLAITVSRPSKYDSHLSFHTIHVRCTISFSHRCYGTTPQCKHHVIHA